VGSEMCMRARYTLNLPEEDRYLKTREELIDFMAMLLGGRAAEISTGLEIKNCE